MSGKKKPAGKQIALCLLLTAAVDGLGVLLVTLLAVKGIVGEDRVPQALGALAFCAAFAGGLPAGKGRLGPGGSLLIIQYGRIHLNDCTIFFFQFHAGSGLQINCFSIIQNKNGFLTTRNNLFLYLR